MLDTVARLREDAAKCADAALWALSDTELATAVEQVHRLEQTIAAVKLHLIGEIEGRDLPSAQQVRDTVTWLRSRLLLDAPAARRLVEQAAALRQHPAVDAALSSGAIHVQQASAITDAVDALPSTAELAAGAEASIRSQEAGVDDGVCEVVSPAEVMAAAEGALLDFASEFAPAPLRRLGARILDHVAPQVADKFDAIALEREERRARRDRGFTMSPPVEGRVRVSGYLTVEDAAIVSAALDPLSFRMADGDFRNPAKRRADALVEVCRLALRTGELPDSGGEPPQLAITVAYDPLERALGVGRLDSGDRISPAAVRRLACDAQLLPVVLGGAGQVLDAGRARRLATGSLRRALVVRDRGCAFPACERSPRWTDGHHITSWAQGGRTDLSNLVLLCRRHHRLIHEGDWTGRIAGDGLPEFIPPPVMGVAQGPRRNLYHRRT